MSVELSIVIVTYNSASDIDTCLASLERHTTGVSYDITVVDNASGDGTAASVARNFPNVHLIARKSNAGLSAAVNEGVAASAGACVATLNPDTRLGEDALSPLVEYLREHRDVGVVAPRLVNPDGTLQLSCRRFPGYATALFNRHSLLTRLLPGNRYSRRYLMTDYDHRTPRDIDWASGAALVFPRAVFERIGGWDAGFFMYNEDVDFCRRAHDAGYRVVYYPHVAIVHEIGRSTRTLPSRMVIERHRSIWRYYRKHLRGGALRDGMTAAGIVARCGYLLAANNVRRVFGRQRA